MLNHVNKIVPWFWDNLSVANPDVGVYLGQSYKEDEWLMMIFRSMFHI